MLALQRYFVSVFQQAAPVEVAEQGLIGARQWFQK
jgi:hypothetical protein